MGDSFTHEFSVGGVNTGRSTPDQQMTVPSTFDVNGNPVGSQKVTNPGVPIMRPSFLQAFLANLGPALAGGLAAEPGHPFGTGLGGAMGGIQAQNQRNREYALQTQASQREQAVAQAQIAASQAQTARMTALTPGEITEQQINLQRMKGMMDLVNTTGGLDQIVSPMSSALGQVTPDEQAQLDSAKSEVGAGLKQGKFDLSPYNTAVQKISQDRLTTTREAQSPDKQALQAYLRNPTLDKGIQKDAATYVAWKAKQNPAFMIMGNMLPPSAIDQQAELYSQTHELPSGLTRSPGTTAAIIKRAAELHPNQNLAANQADYNAGKESLKKLQTNLDQVSAFEGTAIRNLDQVAQAGAKIPDLGTRFANVPVRNISANMIGTPEMARFKTALLTAQTESAKLLNSANATGVLSDNARKEAQQVLDGNLPFPAMMASINQLKTDFGNRHKSYQMQIDDIKRRLGGTSTPPVSATPSAAPATSGFDWNNLPAYTPKPK